jgi:copper chaperone CopZ
MKQVFHISGMTCQGCVASVTKNLSELEGVEEVEVNLDKGLAMLITNHAVPLKVLKTALPQKYSIDENDVNILDSQFHGNETMDKGKTKLRQLKPLVLIFAYLFVASFLLNFRDWNTGEAMLDFMGLFYIVFSFFKFLDLRGFPKSFKMYDPLAKALPIYGWIYPFLELTLGLLFLMRFQITIALLMTILILGITTIGVIKTLLDKKKIQCACLGTALKLPMTEATFIENSIMLVMALWMLF